MKAMRPGPIFRMPRCKPTPPIGSRLSRWQGGLAEIGTADLEAALHALLPYDMQRRLEAEAPTHFETPAGSRIALDYAAEGGPLVSARVQELYGLEQPSVARQRQSAVDLESAVACASADPDHARSARLLARLLGRGENGDERPLSTPCLARRSGQSRADDARKAARNVSRLIFLPAHHRNWVIYHRAASARDKHPRDRRRIRRFAWPCRASAPWPSRSRGHRTA